MPPSWPVTPLAPNPRILTNHPAPSLSAAQEKRIETLWTATLKAYPTLYNGRVFCADILTPTEIHGHWSEYRRVLAQMKDPEIYGTNPLKPLAVVGLLSTPDGIVIGQRSKTSLYLPGYWQGAPAGNVESRNAEDTIDLRAQLLAECEEELGLSPTDCTIGDILLACEHPLSHIIDIGLQVSTPLSFQSLQKKCQTLGNAEYSALHLITPNDKPEGPMVPTLTALLEHT